MKKLKNYIALVPGLLLAGAFLHSCASEEPFAIDGEGVMRMRMVINSDVTRAEIDNEDELRANCVLYISDPNRGLLYKYRGLENVPDQLNMKLGSYVAEAWTGDSVSASFDKKFYRGYQPFTVTAGSNQCVVTCKIANVVASINHKTLGPDMVKSYKVTIGNSRASLEFTDDNAETAKGYFMMPDADTELTYVVEGVNLEGKEFRKEGVIPDVKRAHEYVLNFECHPDYEEVGGGFITVTIDNSEILVEDEIEILSRPSVSLVDNDIDRQIVGNAGKFQPLYLKVAAFGGVKSLRLACERYSEIGLPQAQFDLMNLEESAKATVEAAGLKWDVTSNEAKNLHTAIVTFTTDLLNRIPESDNEYVFNVTAEDTYGKLTEASIRLAVGEGAVVVEDPVVVEPVDQSQDRLAVASTKAVLTATVADDAVNPGILYRESGTTDWQFAPADGSTASGLRRRAAGKTFTVTLKGLKPSTRYEYKAAADGFESKDSYFITTESVFSFPNAGMEEWSKSGKIIIPSADGNVSFWDSGNEAASLASVVLTESSTSMFHSGSASAMLTSQDATVFGMGKFAAGNIFVGEFVERDGTNGVLKLGREFDGSHPSALQVYVNYRPGVATAKGANDNYIAKGQLDKGQIYVALSTQKVDIRTNPSKLKVFNPDDPEILAYGECTLESNFGADGQFDLLNIPIVYNERAKTNKPLYIIVVCTASKYGDYFSGGSSKMYLDDFELVYE